MAGDERALIVFLSTLRFGSSRRPLSPECGLGAPGCLPLTLCGPHSSGDCLEVFSGAEVAAIIAARIAPETTAAIVFVVAVVVAQKRVELLLLLLLLLQALGALSAPPCLLERVSLPHPSASRFSLRSRPPPPHSTSPKRSALQCNKDDEGRMEEAPAR